MRFTVTTDPSNSDLTVTVHVDSFNMSAPLVAPGTYRTGYWNITKKRSPKSAYATAPNWLQSGTATIHFKKNRQLATCAPDWIGTPYHLGGDGPGTCPTGAHSCCFDCSGFQYYLYSFVGITVYAHMYGANERF